MESERIYVSVFVFSLVPMSLCHALNCFLPFLVPLISPQYSHSLVSPAPAYWILDVVCFMSDRNRQTTRLDNCWLWWTQTPTRVCIYVCSLVIPGIVWTLDIIKTHVLHHHQPSSQNPISRQRRALTLESSNYCFITTQTFSTMTLKLFSLEQWVEPTQ